jgi:hypothetical protein
MDGQMKVGDLVRPSPATSLVPKVEHDWIGIVIGFDAWDVGHRDPIVFWSEKFPDETEYEAQLEIVS